MTLKGSNKKIKISLKCPLCKEYHFYETHLRDILSKDPVKLPCYITLDAIALIGDSNEIRKIIHSYFKALTKYRTRLNGPFKVEGGLMLSFNAFSRETYVED